jgi:hypothetical protein
MVFSNTLHPEIATMAFVWFSLSALIEQSRNRNPIRVPARDGDGGAKRNHQNSLFN